MKALPPGGGGIGQLIKSDQIQKKQIRRKVTPAPKENRPTENKKEACFKEIGRRSTEARYHLQFLRQKKFPRKLLDTTGDS